VFIHKSALLAARISVILMKLIVTNLVKNVIYFMEPENLLLLADILIQMNPIHTHIYPIFFISF
jgi:hypothetical protein